MPSPTFIEQKPITLGDIKELIQSVEKRDQQLNFNSNKLKEHLDWVKVLPAKQREELHQKLSGLGITRLKEEVVIKLIDFLPKDANELKAILQGFTLSLAKKDQDSILEEVAKFVK